MGQTGVDVKEVLYELESLTSLFKELDSAFTNNFQFQVPIKCLKKLTNEKLKIIKEKVKEL